MKKLGFVLLAVVLISFNLYSQNINVAPITWEQPTITQDSIIGISYTNKSSEPFSRVIFTVELVNNGVTITKRLEDVDPPKQNLSKISRWRISEGVNTSEPIKITNIAIYYPINDIKWRISIGETIDIITDADLRGDPSVYIEKRWSDVINGKFSFRESYRAKDGMVPSGDGRFRIKAYDRLDERYYWFNFTSEVYVRISPTSSSFILLDDEGNEKSVSSQTINLEGGGTSDTYRLYRISENSNFDPEKKYKVYYRLRSSGPEYKESNLIYIDAIDGLLTYTEARAIDEQARQEAQKIAGQNRIREIAMAYSEAIKVNGVDKIIEYISNYRREDGFNKGSYEEIAKRITGNANISFKEIYTASNPYAFDTSTIYYCGSIFVENFLQGRILAYISNFIIDDGNRLVIRNVPDISKIGKFISNAYLKYIGVTTVTYTNGRALDMAMFDVIYHFDTR